ncbi:MAG: hypothetical protein ACRD4K_03150 [Candidatus Acidiferrales bacterium]
MRKTVWKILAAVLAMAGVAILSTHLALARMQAPGKVSGAILHEERTFTINVAEAPETVFPLFGPVCEGVWAPGWQPAFLYPRNGGTEEGSVFTTRGPHGGEAIWILSEYDAQRRELQYIQVIPGVLVAELQIHVQEGTNQISQVRVLHRWTTLSPTGESLLARHLEEFAEQGPHWEKAIHMALSQGRTCAGVGR